MRKSRGKPVPVKCSSSQSPSGRWRSQSQAAARVASSVRDAPAATRPMSAQAVWDGVPRAAPQLREQRPKLPFGADGVHLDATVAQIPRVAGDALLLRRVAGEEAIPDALHSAGNVESPRPFLFGHAARVPRRPATVSIQGGDSIKGRHTPAAKGMKCARRAKSRLGQVE